MANLYYAEHLDPADFHIGRILEVAGDEARHAVRVARLRVGERISVSDGIGHLAHGEVLVADRDRFEVRIDETSYEPAPSTQLALVQSLAKGDRDERAVEQSTEFGVDVIMPWQASRSVSRWDGSSGEQKAAKGVSKWARVAREAAKQSMRVRIPQVTEPTSLAWLCERAGQSNQEVLVLHPRGDEQLSAWANGQLKTHTEAIFVVVGPEGGLTDEELTALDQAGAHVLLLGSEVLRTSSAGPAALAVLNVALQRW